MKNLAVAQGGLGQVGIGAEAERREDAHPPEPLAGDDRRVSDSELLPRTLALFKTPALRALAFSHPYLHNGSVPTLHHLLGPVSERPKIFQVSKLLRDWDGQT